MTGDRVVIVPNGASANNAVTTYVDTLIHELKKHFPVLEVSVRSPEFGRVLDRIEGGEALAYVSVANIGQLFKMTPNKVPLKRLLEKSKTSFIFVDFDHPLLVAEHLPFLPRGGAYTNPSPLALEFVRPFLPVGTVSAVFTHGADQREPLRWDQRDIPCVFPGNLIRTPEEILEGWKALASVIRVPLQRMARIYLENENKAPRGLADIAHEVLGPVEEAKDVTAYIRQVAEFDSYARQRARFDLIEKVKDAPVTFIGAGWDAYPASNRSFLGRLTASQTLETMRRARIVLNITANYFSSHERVFGGMMQGSAIGTFGADFLKGLGGEESDPILYLTPDSIDDRLCAALDDDAALRERAERGTELALKHHTWAKRAEFLAKLITDAQQKFS